MSTFTLFYAKNSLKYTLDTFFGDKKIFCNLSQNLIVQFFLPYFAIIFPHYGQLFFCFAYLTSKVSTSPVISTCSGITMLCSSMHCILYNASSISASYLFRSVLNNLSFIFPFLLCLILPYSSCTISNTL